MVDGKVLTLPDRHYFHNHFLFDNAVDDSDSFLGSIELVIACEVETCHISQVLAEEGRRFELLELLGDRFFEGTIEVSKVVGSVRREVTLYGKALFLQQSAEADGFATFLAFPLLHETIDLKMF